MTIADARKDERERRKRARDLVLAMLSHDRGRTFDALRASLERSHGSAWRTGLRATLVELRELGLAREEEPDTWFRARPRIEAWVQTLPPELRAQISAHDIAALVAMVRS